MGQIDCLLNFKSGAKVICSSLLGTADTEKENIYRGRGIHDLQDTVINFSLLIEIFGCDSSPRSPNVSVCVTLAITLKFLD